MQTKKRVLPVTRKSVAKKYFHGIIPLVANATGYTTKYVYDVLSGIHDERTTDAVKKIKDTADLFMTPVNSSEIITAS